MQKTFYLGILFACTTHVYSSEQRLETQTPPFPKIGQSPIGYAMDTSLRLSPTSAAPAAQSGVTSLLSPSPNRYSQASATEKSPLQMEAIQAKIFDNKLTKEHQEIIFAQLNEELAQLDKKFIIPILFEAFVKLHQIRIATLSNKFDENIQKLTAINKEEIDEIQNINPIVEAMRNPARDQDLRSFSQSLHQQNDLARRCGIGQRPSYLPSLSGQHNDNAYNKIVFK